MILVLDMELVPDYRYLGPSIARLLPNTDYHVVVDDPDVPPVDDYDGVVLSGSTHSVYDEEDRGEWYDVVWELVGDCLARETPLLGICYGHQFVNRVLGGRVEADRRRATFVEMTEYDQSEEGVLAGLEPVVPVLHGDVVTDLGDGMRSVARTDYDDNFCSVHEEEPVWTVQFHPEFTPDLADEPSDWDPGDYSFEDCNATRVYDNFARHVAARREEPASS